jgi:hypothetical protein
MNYPAQKEAGYMNVNKTRKEERTDRYEYFLLQIVLRKLIN